MAVSSIASERGLALLAGVREICLRYPEVEEQVDGFGHTSFRVRDKPFVIMGEYEGRTSMHFKLLHETQDYLVQTGRFERSGYIGQHGWTALAKGEEVDWDEAADLIDEGYRRAAPKTLVKKLDG